MPPTPSTPSMRYGPMRSGVPWAAGYAIVAVLLVAAKWLTVETKSDHL